MGDLGWVRQPGAGSGRISQIDTPVCSMNSGSCFRWRSQPLPTNRAEIGQTNRSCCVEAWSKPELIVGSQLSPYECQRGSKNITSRLPCSEGRLSVARTGRLQRLLRRPPHRYCRTLREKAFSLLAPCSRDLVRRGAEKIRTAPGLGRSQSYRNLVSPKHPAEL
jgi:hypothetical protein